jgi:5-methyltetrahydropteroyltriglutamate--homocysteine methyltransferase
MAAQERGEIGDADLAGARDDAVRDTIRRLEEIGSPVVTDGEQAKPSFATYPVSGSRAWSRTALSSRSPTAISGSCPG